MTESESKRGPAGRELWAKIWHRILNRSQCQINGKVEFEAWYRIDAQIWSQVKDRVEVRVGRQVRDQVAPQAREARHG